MGGLPPTVHAGLAKKYGINKSRYFVHPQVATRYLGLNTQRLFGNLALRKAANLAIDRKGMINLRGAFAGHATDQLLPSNLRGYKNANIFPFRPNIAAAKKLAGNAKHNAVMYTTTSPVGTNQGVLVQSLYKNIGLNVDVNRYGTSTMYKKCGTKSEAVDICNVGWIADYPDPFDFMNVLLSGESIHDSNNNNYSYFNNARYNRQMNSAAKLFGGKRFSTYGSLDVNIMKAAAPIVAWDNDNDREFISGKTGCYTNQPVYGLADLAVLCVK
jgi:ABC-type transport system substrate-binding protein